MLIWSGSMVLLLNVREGFYECDMFHRVDVYTVLNARWIMKVLLDQKWRDLHIELFILYAKNSSPTGNFKWLNLYILVSKNGLNLRAALALGNLLGLFSLSPNSLIRLCCLIGTLGWAKAMTQISKKTKATKKHFPPEIFFEIVSRLPLKSVGRYTSVSKSWYSFIKSSAFIAAHLNKSIASKIDNDSLHYLLYVPPLVEDYKLCTAFSDNMMNFDVLYDVELPMDFELKRWRPIGSCNSLVCLTDDDEDFHGHVIYMWNLVLRKYKCITGTCCRKMLCHEYTRVYVGFWHDDEKNDYKLIRILCNVDINELNNQSQVEIYSLNTSFGENLTKQNYLGKFDSHIIQHL